MVDGNVHGAECVWECALENSLAVSQNALVISLQYDQRLFSRCTPKKD